jgi:hypothetical protein
MELINDINALAVLVGPGCTPSVCQTLPFLAVGPLSTAPSSKLFLFLLSLFKATDFPFRLQPPLGGVGDAGGVVALDRTDDPLEGAGVTDDSSEGAGVSKAGRDKVNIGDCIHGNAALEGCWARMLYKSFRAGDVFEAGNSRRRSFTSLSVRINHIGWSAGITLDILEITNERS